MTKSNHTPTPWGLTRDDNDSFGVSIRGSVEGNEYANEHVCSLLPKDYRDERKEERTANAALIVHRVNNWDKLVEALAAINKLASDITDETDCEGYSYHSSDLREAFALIDTALALARERQ